jgi:hypothetical protein
MKRILGTALLLIVATASAFCQKPTYPWVSQYLTTLNGNTRYPCGLNGANAGAQISTAITLLQPTGGVVDARCYQGPQVISTDIFSAVTKNVVLILPNSTITINATVTIPANFTIYYSASSVLTPGGGHTLTDNSQVLTVGGPNISGYGINLARAQRPPGSYAYLVGIADNGGASSGLMSSSGAAYKTYAFNIAVNRPIAAAVTGDSNDALYKGSVNNYAANDANFIQRVFNGVSNNRSGGTLGTISGGLISASNKSGATAPTVLGAEIGVENFGTNATMHGAVDASVKNEGAKAATEFGVRVRNLNNSIGGTSGAAFLVSEPSLANLGWDFIVDANGVKVGGHAFARMQNGACIYFGSQTTRDAVRAEVGTGGAIGSFYASSARKMYLKVANAGATTDWQLVTATAAD